jgi:nucleoside-diphosphate-sugar epimerase
MTADRKPPIFVAGHGGMVGSALLRELAARVGGIYANDTYPAEFIHDNVVIEVNVIHAVHVLGVRRLMFVGSSCIYPREAPQPMLEEALLCRLYEAVQSGAPHVLIRGRGRPRHLRPHFGHRPSCRKQRRPKYNGATLRSGQRYRHRARCH